MADQRGLPGAGAPGDHAERPAQRRAHRQPLTVGRLRQLAPQVRVEIRAVDREVGRGDAPQQRRRQVALVHPVAPQVQPSRGVEDQRPSTLPVVDEGRGAQQLLPAARLRPGGVALAAAGRGPGPAGQALQVEADVSVTRSDRADIAACSCYSRDCPWPLLLTGDLDLRVPLRLALQRSALGGEEDLAPVARPAMAFSSAADIRQARSVLRRLRICGGPAGCRARCGR